MGGDFVKIAVIGGGPAGIMAAATAASTAIAATTRNVRTK